MNNRQTLLTAIQQATVATLDDLADLVPKFSRQKLRDTINDCRKSGFISLEKDVTGLPAYRLSPAGKDYLLNPPNSSVKTTPATGGAHISGSQAPEPLVEEAEHPAGGLAVVEAVTQDEAPAEPASDEMQYSQGDVTFMESMIRKALSIEHDKCIGIIPTIEALIESNNDWRRAAEQNSSEVDRPTNHILELKTELAGAYSELTDMRRSALFYAPTESTTDMVNHPPHYQGKVECIDAIEAALGPVGFAAYCRGNAMKYTFRAGKKGDYAEDLNKAEWYLRRAKA